jgi:hypothetical protein
MHAQRFAATCLCRVLRAERESEARSSPRVDRRGRTLRPRRVQRTRTDPRTEEQGWPPAAEHAPPLRSEEAGPGRRRCVVVLPTRCWALWSALRAPPAPARSIRPIRDRRAGDRAVPRIGGGRIEGRRHGWSPPASSLGVTAVARDSRLARLPAWRTPLPWLTVAEGRDDAPRARCVIRGVEDRHARAADGMVPHPSAREGLSCERDGAVRRGRADRREMHPQSEGPRTVAVQRTRAPRQETRVAGASAERVRAAPDYSHSYQRSIGEWGARSSSDALIAGADALRSRVEPRLVTRWRVRAPTAIASNQGGARGPVAGRRGFHGGTALTPMGDGSRGSPPSAGGPREYPCTRARGGRGDPHAHHPVVGRSRRRRAEPPECVGAELAGTRHASGPCGGAAPPRAAKRLSVVSAKREPPQL